VVDAAAGSCFRPIITINARHNSHFITVHCFDFDSERSVRVRMKLWLVCEHPDSWGGVPRDIREVICGVFLTRAEAMTCLQACISMHNISSDWALTIQDDDTACDATAQPYYQIVEL
jgi:hypothetical protein